MSKLRINIILPVAVTLVAGILINVLVYIEVSQGERVQKIVNFEDKAISQILKISNGINSYLLSLHSLTTWLESEKESGVFVQKEFFKQEFDFTASNFLSNLPSAQYYALATYDTLHEKSVVEYLLKQKNEINSLFNVDISSDIRTKEAFVKAHSSGKMYASTNTHMEIKPADGNSIIILSPLFQSEEGGNEEQGKKTIYGFGIMAFDLTKFMQNILDDNKNDDIDLYLYDLDDPSMPTNKRLLYSSRQLDDTELLDTNSLDTIIEGAYMVKNIFLANRPISIVLLPASSSIGQYGVKHSHIFLVGGLILSFSLAGFLYNFMRYSEDIENRVSQRTIELRESLRNLENEMNSRATAEKNLRLRDSQLAHSQRLATMGEMAAGIAHELNQPLTGIMNYAENATEFLNPEKPDIKTAQENMGKIVGQTVRAKGVIKHLQEFTKKGVSNLVKVDINQLINNSLELLAPRLKTFEIDVTRKLAPSLPLALGNDIQLEQVFINIITNSIDALSDRDQKKINISSSQNGDNSIIIEFIDNGVGLNEDVQEKIFNAFYSTKHASNGTGLGLAICKRIMTEHEGSITGGADDEGNTLFTIELPIRAGTNEQ